MSEKKTVIIEEVGPRDGFQNLCAYLPAEEKLKFIDGLVESGVKHMQITSFVSPKAIPQMQDSKQVAAACVEKYPDLDLFALIPNFRGAQTAQEVGIKRVSNVISLSVSHNKANINRTHDESFAELAKIKTECPDLTVCLDVATTFGCPFEGKYLDPQPMLDFIKRGWDLGVTSFNLCDTVGVADPAQVRLFLAAAKETFPKAQFGVHIHDTRGMGLVNTLAAIEAGAEFVQTTLGGLGGCPFAPGASGNTATEDLVLMLNSMGYETGIDFEKIMKIARQEFAEIDGNFSGHNICIKPKN